MGTEYMKKIHNIIFLGVAVLMVCSTAAGIGYKSNNSSMSSDNILLNFRFSELNIQQIEKDDMVYCRVQLDNLPHSNNKYMERLPVKPVKVLIPYGKEVDSIEVHCFGKSVLPLDYSIEQGHAVIPLDENRKGSSKEIQKSDTKGRLYLDGGIHIVRGYTILFVTMYPVHYSTNTGELFLYTHLQLQVHVKNGDQNQCIRDVQMDKDVVTNLVDNPECIATYADALLPQNRETVEYMIITNEDLKDATGDFTFQDLIDSRVSDGMSADIMTVEDIEDNSDYWVNGKWGDNNKENPFYNGTIQGNVETFNDTQAKIRNFIRYAYMELDTKYVLLGGDGDTTPSDNIIPVRELFAVEDGLPLGFRDLVEEDIPSDVYYACLDGNFNRDEDIHWGENATQNEYDDFDEADLLCEVYVGRACVDAEDEVSNFVMKTTSYEDCDDPYIFTGLMVGEYLGFPGVSAYGGNYKDLIIPIFPELFTVDTLYDRDGTWNKATLKTMLNTDTKHLINHLGHGNVHYALKMGTSDILSLTNDKFFFIYSQTCLAGAFDNSGTDCAAECFTVETEHGAFAVVMNARYGLGSEDSLDSPSQVVDESFFNALFNESLPELGRANHYAKEDHIWHINENGIRWVYYETNLFGDPALRIKPYSDPPETPPRPDGPSEGVSDIEYSFTSRTTDPNGDKIYYKFNWGDGTTSDWLGPFVSGDDAIATHSWNAAGMYEITVKAKDDNKSEETSWSEPLSIHILQKPTIEIGLITGGLFKVKAVITNVGEVDSTKVTWNISLDGGVWLGKKTTGTLTSIGAGSEATISSNFILGWGDTRATITVDIPEGSDTRSQRGTIYLFFVLISPGG
jgi:hypothetical protein